MLGAAGSLPEEETAARSKPQEAVQGLTTQDGGGRAVDGPQAGDGSAEQRRSSVLVVTLGQRQEHKGAAATAAAMVVNQLRLTLMAFGIALLMAPVAAAFEPLVEFFIKSLPSFSPSASCRGLLTDQSGVDLVVVSGLSSLVLRNGFQVAAVDANPRAIRLLRHTLLVGPVVFIVFPAWYASAVSSPTAFTVCAYSALGFVVVDSVPSISDAACRLATARRKSYTRAARGLIGSLCVTTVTIMAAVTTAFYVVLSDRVSGFAGVVINGKGHWLA
jgi:hypothetical protein